MGREAFDGFEFDWFAVDASGHVGHFSTAGYGPVPLPVLERLDVGKEGDLWSLGERLLVLPTIGSATGHASGHIDDWLALARRGLYGFDWKHWSGPYLRRATPDVPIKVEAIPDDLQRLVRLVEFPRVTFAEMKSIRPEDLCPCG